MNENVVLTPERILEATEDVLRRFGLAKATVVDVARALDVSHGSVYRHFPSKASLREAVAKRWRDRVNAPEARAIAKDLAAWARTIPTDTWPEMPPGVIDRNTDVWEALLAVADHAGGDWPLRARAAAEDFVRGSKDVPMSTGVRLLADLRAVFANREQLSTVEIISALVEMEDSTWDLDPRRLSRMLAKYDHAPLCVGLPRCNRLFLPWPQPTRQNPGLAAQ